MSISLLLDILTWASSCPRCSADISTAAPAPRYVSRSPGFRCIATGHQLKPKENFIIITANLRPAGNTPPLSTKGLRLNFHAGSVRLKDLKKKLKRFISKKKNRYTFNFRFGKGINFSLLN